MAIYDDAFSGCTALTSVIFGGSRADWESITFNTGNDALRRVTPTCTGSTGLAAPVVTGSTNRSGMPLIQWNKVSGAAGYQLWCSRVYEDFGAVGYDLYADGNEDWFWDGNRCTYMNNGSLEDGVTYSYKVRAVDANGNVGAFQNTFFVYGRGGQLCRRCGTELEKGRIAGRATVFCPQCQK